jgi:hypothetical protein
MKSWEEGNGVEPLNLKLLKLEPLNFERGPSLKTQV